MTEIIRCNDVTLRYENHTVIDHLTFHVCEGDYLCIVGENGSGKSTLMRALLGLKAVSGGSIELSGGLRKNQIGYLPQQSSIQRDFPANVSEVVLSGTLNRSGAFMRYSKEAKALAEANMRKLDIWDLRRACYRELSGGQQQRVLLSRALCATSKLLLLDEPTTGLDPVVSADFYHLIEKLNREDGITVIMVSHDVQSALRYASHMLHLHSGSTFFGPKEAYLECRECRTLLGGEEAHCHCD